MSKVYFYTKQVLFYLVLAAYVYLLAKTLLFKNVSPFELFSAERIITRPHNFIPLKSIFQYLNSNNIWITLLNVAGNIVIFIPLGIYLQMFMKNKNILKCVALMFAISFGAEVLQYILGLGAADVDDIILNTIGGLLGIFTYRIVYFVLKNENKTRAIITFLFCLVPVCFFVLMRLSGLRIKLF